MTTKLTKDDLLLTLQKAEPEAAKAAALEVLGSEAKEWWAYRKSAEAKRIVDPVSGKWASEFTANGKRFYVRSAKDGIGLKRYTKLRQMMSLVGFNATYNDQIAAIARIKEAANSLITAKPQLDRLFSEVSNFELAIFETKNRNWDLSTYTATLFVVRPGEDLTDWTEQDADEKIADWNAEGIHEHDFFLLVMFWATQQADMLSAFYDRLRAMGLTG